MRLDARGGVVAVSGELPTRHAKWLCVECCRRVAGVIKVIDKMKVESAASEMPATIQFASVPRNRLPIHRRTTGRHVRWTRTAAVATREMVAASQQLKLRAAA